METSSETTFPDASGAALGKSVRFGRRFLGSLRTPAPSARHSGSRHTPFDDIFFSDPSDTTTSTRQNRSMHGEAAEEGIGEEEDEEETSPYFGCRFPSPQKYFLQQYSHDRDCIRTHHRSKEDCRHR